MDHTTLRWWTGMILAGCFAIATARPVEAQQWARDMFAETQHDFGKVARGSEPEFRFEFTNKYRETVHISAVRSSCGCTDPQVAEATIASGETGGILAKFNTTAFSGSKAATITVVFDRPYYAEVQLFVTGEILTDVHFNPSEVDFGEVAEGEQADQDIEVTFMSHPNLHIKDVRSLYTHLRVRLGERQVRQGTVHYTLNVGLKPTAPQGELNERLTLVTDDPRLRSVVVEVSGRIRPPVEVRPDAVHLGSVAEGESISERLLVRGAEAFEVKEVVCEDPRFSFSATEGAKKVHFVKMTFTNDGSASGKFRVPVEIQTQLPSDASAVCTVTGEAE